MGRRHKQGLQHVPFLGISALDTHTAAALGPVGVEAHALDVPIPAEGHRHQVLGDQIRHIEIGVDLFRRDLRAALVTVDLLQILEVLAHHRRHPYSTLQDVFEVCNLLYQGIVLGQQLVALKAGQAAKAHVHDGLTLTVRELVLRTQ